MMIASIIMNVILLFLLGVSIYCFFKLGKAVIEIENQVEESLDILDESYQAIGKILETPVMSDDIFVRQVLSDIKSAHDAVLLVASKIVVFGGEDDEDSEE